MRAGSWLTNRDIVAARASWLRAKAVADRLPADDANRVELRIEPRTLLCASAFRGGDSVADTGFDELRELCTTAGDHVSSAIAMAGLAVTLTLLSRHREASRLASEHAELLESIGDPTMTVALLHGAMTAKYYAGELHQACALAQRVIDLADGDVALGEVLIGSPLAQATMLRGMARAGLGQTGWREDLDQAYEISRASDSATRVIVSTYPYGMLLQNEALIPDATAMQRTAEALTEAEQSGDDFTLSMARFTHGVLLLGLPDADQAFGVELLVKARESVRRHGSLVGAMPACIAIAAHKTRTGDVDGGIEDSRAILSDISATGEMIMRGPVTVVLVESLLDRGGDRDIEEAQAVIEHLASVPAEPGFLLFELPLLRMRALLARARGEEPTYAEFRDRYSAMATSVGFPGHVAIAAAMD